MSTFEKGDMQASGAGPTSAAAAAPALTDTTIKTNIEAQEAEATDDDVSQQNSGSQVDVEKAQAQFEALGRELSRQSTAHRTKPTDEEKADSEDEFDLLTYIRGTQDAADQAGIKHKHVGVTWKNLTVTGSSGISLSIRTFGEVVWQTFLWAPLALAMKFGAFNSGTRKLLDNFSGCAKPGEMVLVLGRPGSGCSTFLKTIANQHGGFISVEGDLKYAGIDHKEFAKRYQGEVVYNEEDDQHNANLTVGRTLNFALSTKTPGRLLPNETKASFKKQTLETFLKMLGISHTIDTLVGSAFVRGVSGGERKRVSIAEMLCTRAAVLSWDNSTRGLDASTALDYAKSLRILTNCLKTTTFVSLYQAGEGIFDLFDKVLLIDDGKCAYYGSREEARPYLISLGFQDLPRQTSGDWICGVTDPNLASDRRFQEGRDETNTPSTPEKMEAAYLESDIRKKVIQELEEYEAYLSKEKSVEEEFRQAVIEDKNKGVSKKSQYTVPFLTQVYALWIRQMQVVIGDKLDIFVSFGTAIAIAIITGSLFLNLPETAAGGFTRGGVIFIAELFNALTAFNELPVQMGGRPILFKQQGFAFYRPAALSIANLLSDIPFSIVRIFVFSVIIYFMAGLALSAGAFFTFFINVYVAYLAMSALFRIFGTICSSYDLAARLAAVIISAMVVFAGYVIPRNAMQRWNFWISYLNPLYFGFSALMINEFKDLNLACVDSYVTPRNTDGTLTQYPANVGEYQVCTLPGASPGQQSVPGLDYIRASFGYEKSDLWLDFGVVVIFFVGLVALTCIVIEVFQHGRHSSALKVGKKPSKDEQQKNEALKARRANKDTEKGEQEESQLDINACTFTWEDLNYTVPVKGGDRQLLNSVYGYCKPGSLTALMGASGAGKTTLLDVLADRKSIGVISGDRLVNGRPVGTDFQRSCAYAEQQDVHEATATVREAMQFSAYLRQPAHVSKEEKDAWVEECIFLLELEDLADAMIGYTAFGLGVGDRKRCTIGVELAAKPDLLLFLDEPTSGLDGQTAYNVVRFLKKLANAGQAILCTIHQPNSLLFEMFDRLLLLERGGNTVYFGPIGPDSKHIVKYFADHGAHCPSDVNPAEYMLDAIGAGSKKRVGDRAWSDVYRDSDLFQENLKTIAQLKEECLAQPDNHEAVKEYATSFGFQLSTVLKRTLLASWRQPDYQFTRLFQHGAIALITSLVFLQLGNSVASLQYRIFGIFIATVVPAIILAQIEPFYIMARSTFIREDSSKMYTGVVFALCQFASEMPFSVACSIVYFLLFYYPIGFNYDSNRAGYFFAMFLVTEVFSVTLGQAISALSPSIYIAALTNPFFILIMSLFCGVTIPAVNMPYFWRVWMYQLNPFTRLVGSLISNELEGLEVRCTETEFATFQPPGMTCSAWADPFVQKAGGYLQNPDDRADCQYCQYSTGSEFYEPLGIYFSNRGRDIGILICYIAFNAIVLMVAAKFIKYSNR